MITRGSKWLGGIAALLTGWLAVLAFVMVQSDSAPAALVLLPTAGFLNDLPNDVAILSRNAVSITLATDQPTLAARLYLAGAWLVLPSGLKGCAPVS